MISVWSKRGQNNADSTAVTWYNGKADALAAMKRRFRETEHEHEIERFVLKVVGGRNCHEETLLDILRMDAEEKANARRCSGVHQEAG